MKERNVDYYVMLYVLIVYAFNNQIRFNRNGEFNLPPGKRDFNQKMHSKVENFIELLQNQNATFIHSDFREIEIDKLTDKDFVYVDPPYLLLALLIRSKGGGQKLTKRIYFKSSMIYHKEGLNLHYLMFWNPREEKMFC